MYHARTFVWSNGKVQIDMIHNNVVVLHLLFVFAISWGTHPEFAVSCRLDSNLPRCWQWFLVSKLSEAISMTCGQLSFNGKGGCRMWISFGGCNCSSYKTTACSNCWCWNCCAIKLTMRHQKRWSQQAFGLEYKCISCLFILNNVLSTNNNLKHSGGGRHSTLQH